MNTSSDEILVEVDKNDNVIEEIVKRDAHSDSTRYHRAAHIMIFNSHGEVILQKRSFNKFTSPGKWDMHGGHQVAGQSIEQCAVAELSEELGITTDLKFHHKGLYQDDFQSEYFYLFVGTSDGPYGFDKNEVECIGTFDCQKLLDSGYDGEFDILPHVIKYVRELKDYWRKLKDRIS